MNLCLQYKASKSRGEKLHQVFRSYIWNNVESMAYAGGMKNVGTCSSQKTSRTFPAQVRTMYSGTQQSQAEIRPWTINLEAHSDSARRLD